MLLNYLKLSIRLMARDPFFTFIKVSGLAVGLAVFFILWQYTQSELNSDHQWKDADRIYRFGNVVKWTDDKVKWDESYFATNIPSLIEQIAVQYPELTEVTRILPQQNFRGISEKSSCVADHGTDLFLSAQNGNEKKSFKEDNLVYADPNVITFFGLPLIDGHPESALSLAGSIALSESLAIKYFGTTKAVGNDIRINDKILLTVTAVFKDLPRNTHLYFNAIISSERIKNKWNTVSQEVHTPLHYIKIKYGEDVPALSKRINHEMHEQIRSSMCGWDLCDVRIYMQPLSEMPFQSYVADAYNTKSALGLRILQLAAVAILLLAWINYINLTSAENLKRIKEVATRRTMGASVAELVTQFVIEAFTTNLLALGVAMTLIQLLKTPMESAVGFYFLSWTNLLESTLWILILAFVTGVLVTGLYPTWFIMSQNSRGRFGNILTQQRGFSVVFTTLQYSIAIVIAVFAFTIKEQLNYVLNFDIGLNKNEVVVVDLPLENNSDFKAELATFLGKVRDAGPSISRTAGGEGHSGMISLSKPGVGAGPGVSGDGGVDENFIPLYQIEILAGRNFLSDNPADSTSVLISDITSERMGFKTPEEAVGSRALAGMNGRDVEVIIAGVYKDYNTLPLLNTGFFQSKGSALTYKDYLFPGEPWSRPQKVSFRLSVENFEESLEKIRSAYLASFSDQFFNWSFLDSQINGRYQQHILVGNQISLFCFLAVGIACLGLLGMMLHKVNAKVKEIGIRKVLGAQLYHVAQVLLSTSTKQIMIAAMIGIPVAFYLTEQYLQKFSQRMDLRWWHLALPIAILLAIMFATIASTIWRAARNNPVEALKHE
jgi:putative ABC transport system permease protein